MRSVTTFLLESSWERDFSCLSISSSTFSTHEGAMSLVEQSIELVVLLLLLVLGALSHQDLEDLSQPFLDLSPLQVFAERVEGVSLPLELSRGVDLVGHDPRDGLLHVLHPLGHLVMPHVVHLLDELVVLLPKKPC